MSKEKFIVLDCEGMSAKPPYNIGFIVADKYGKIYKKYSFAIPENICLNIIQSIKTNQATEMTTKNIQEVLADFNKPKLKRKYKFISNNCFINFFIKIIKRFKVKRLFAYNITFDKNCLKYIFGECFCELEKLIEFCDIIPLILYSKLLTEDYCKWCIENNFVTNKGNIQTKAETVYKYLTKDLTFKEEHTGLADVYIEYKILLMALENHCEISTKPCQAWRILRNFCTERNIEIAV